MNFTTKSTVLQETFSVCLDLCFRASKHGFVERTQVLLIPWMTLECVLNENPNTHLIAKLKPYRLGFIEKDFMKNDFLIFMNYLLFMDDMKIIQKLASLL